MNVGCSQFMKEAFDVGSMLILKEICSLNLNMEDALNEGKVFKSMKDLSLGKRRLPNYGGSSLCSRKRGLSKIKK